MAQKRSGFQFWGTLLIVAGILLLLGQFNLLKGEYFLYYLSGMFFVVYFLLGATANYGNIGFLIPACVLLAINAFADLESMDYIEELGGGVFFFFLALAFVGVYLHTMRYKGDDWGTRNWPLFPAGGLMLFGAMVLFIEHTEIRIQVENFEGLGAVVLIALGVYFYVKGLIKQRRGKVEEHGQKGSE